jgi:hypothetical protein
MGDATSAKHLWDNYFHRLIALARGRLGTPARGGADNDGAQSVFKSLCLGADRDNLWDIARGDDCL